MNPARTAAILASLALAITCQAALAANPGPTATVPPASSPPAAASTAAPTAAPAPTPSLTPPPQPARKIVVSLG